MMDAAAYQDALLSLLPQGLPWPRETATVLGQWLGSWADTLARVDTRAADLLDECDPRTTVQRLADWERAYGLPDPCLGALGDDALRRAALLVRVTGQGGQSPAYYLALAAALGFSASITEFDVIHDVTQPVTAALTGTAWAYRWTLHLDVTVPVQHWRVDGRVDTALGSWVGNAALECLLRRLKPAHTLLVISYQPAVAGVGMLYSGG